jgi:peroxiredoxin Q/BCP
MAAKRAPVLAKKKSASSTKTAPKMAKAAPKAKSAAKATAAAKATLKKASPPTKSAATKPTKAKAKESSKKAAPPPKASASNGKKAAGQAKTAKSKGTAKPLKVAVGGLAVGDTVPEVELSDHEGNRFSLSSLGGQPYVLYFYPKDDTPGCTREACAFRDDIGKFEGQGVRVFGVSPDKPESHARFRTKYGLPFTLLSDADKSAANAFGVWVKKQNYGREYMGIERSTFFVDADGKVKKIWRNVKVDGHSQAVLDAAAPS